MSAILKNPVAYEHMDSELVGNQRRVLVSDLSGKSNIKYKAKEFGISMDDGDSASKKIVQEIKRMEDQGYTFDAADGSLAVLIKRTTGEFKVPFKLESLRVLDEKSEDTACSSKAMIKISVDGLESKSRQPRETDRSTPSITPFRKALTTFTPRLKKCTCRFQSEHPGGLRWDRSQGEGLDRIARLERRLEHDRGLGKHHRGKLAGPGGQHPVQTQQISAVCPITLVCCVTLSLRCSRTQRVRSAPRDCRCLASKHS